MISGCYEDDIVKNLTYRDHAIADQRLAHTAAPSSQKVMIDHLNA